MTRQRYRPLPKISEACILKVKQVFEIYESVSQYRISKTCAYLDTLNETEIWLLAFVQYLTKGKRRWLGIDFGPYWLLPAARKQTSTFEDFLQLLKHYSLRRITHKNERELIRFLLGCTAEIRDFYEIVMTKGVGQIFDKAAIRQYLSVAQIRPEDIYGDPTFMSDHWKAISYPLMITTVPPAERLVKATIHCSSRGLRIRKYIHRSPRDIRYRRTPVPIGWLHLDKQSIHTDKYLLVGLMDEQAGEFYPVDYFENAAEYLWFIKGSKKTLPYDQRLKKLERFFDTNYLRQIKRLPQAYCSNHSQITNAAARVLLGSPHQTVLICDGKDRMLYSTTILLEGIIADYWRDEIEQVLGFLVWNNGRIVHCSFDFSGNNHGLLYAPLLVLQKYVRFYLFQQQGFEAGAVTEILFDKKLYKPLPYVFRDGTEGYIECCPFCLRDDTPHSHNGICDNTLKNWYYMLKNKGVDTWFQVTPKLQKRRAEKCWRPEFLNNITAVFQGYRVVADPQGQIMFQTDREAREIYDRRVAELTLLGRMPDIKPRKESDETGRSGAVCQVQPTLEQVAAPDHADGGSAPL